MLFKKYTIAALLFTTVFLVYFNTLAPTITAVGDSGELIVAAYTTGIPHAPGYPLYTMLGNLATKIPFGSSIAWKVNLLSSVFHSLAVVLLFFVALEVLGNIKGVKEKDKDDRLTQLLAIISALTASLILAFSYLFWHLSLVAEVFALNNFFAVLLLLLALKWRKQLWKKEFAESKKWLLGFAFIYGLALTNHHSITLLLPGFLYLFITNISGNNEVGGYLNLKLLGLSFIVFTLGLLPYLYLPIQAAKNPAINWGNPDNLERFIRIVARADYGTFKLSPQIPGASEKTFGIIGQITSFIKELYESTNLWVAGIFLYGLFILYKKEKKLFFFLSFQFLLPTFIFLSAANLSTEGVWQTVIKRFYLLPMLIFAVFIGVGIYQINMVIASRGERLFANGKLLPLVTSIFMLFVLVVPLFLKQKPKADQNGNTLLYDFGQCILSTLPQNSIFLTYGENTWSALHYLKLVEKKREDIILIDQAGFTYPWYQDEVEKNYGSKIKLPEPKQKSGSILTNLISINLDQYPTFAQTLFDKEALLDFQTVPWGLVLQFMPEKAKINSDEILQKNKTFFTNCPIPDLTPSNYPPFSYERDLVHNWSRAYARIGEFAAKYQKWQEAVFWYQKSVEIWPENATFQRGLREVLFKLDIGRSASAKAMVD